MADNDDIKETSNIPALFAEITALLEDAHEIAVRGQNSKLERADYLKAADAIARELDRMEITARQHQAAVAAGSLAPIPVIAGRGMVHQNLPFADVGLGGRRRYAIGGYGRLLFGV